MAGASGSFTFVVSINGHMHKFELENKISDFVKGTPCAVCNERIRIRRQHCVYCKIKVHKNCVQQSARLPCIGQQSGCNDYPDTKGSPNVSRKLQLNSLAANQTNLRPAHSTPAFQGSDSNSASSCTSSAPGSPFGIGANVLNPHPPVGPGCPRPDPAGTIPIPVGSPPAPAPGPATIGTAGGASVAGPAGPSSLGHSYGLAYASTSRLPSPVGIHSCTTGQPHSPRHMGGGGSAAGGGGMCCNQFEFPNVNPPIKDGLVPSISLPPEEVDPNQLVSTMSSAESEQTVIDQNVLRRFESIDSQDDTSSLLTRTNSISVTLKEWDIPIEHLVIGEVIGRGTFCTVYRAKWHGEVAVKLIDFDPEDADGSVGVEAFKREVALLHKTRHENLVLFMGACMKPPNLAIVTQLSQGETLYHLLHHRDNAMAINRTINIASQIAKGMGYLHAKGIVHRDLKTRNIFVEANSRVVIGDFGLFNFVRLCKKAKWGSYLNVPPFWLCYVAPEIIRALNWNCVVGTTANELPLTTKSDVYAFGTVWYELLTNEFPFKGLPSQTVTYMVGCGIKQNLRTPCLKDFKDILLQCWAFQPSRRPEFTTLVKSLDRLPKLHRSPSYPTKTHSGVTSASHSNLLM